eukprot:5440082-Amphidinium_carterae.1
MDIYVAEQMYAKQVRVSESQHVLFCGQPMPVRSTPRENFQGDFCGFSRTFQSVRRDSQNRHTWRVTANGSE